ncbi:MAG TPA: hypothetical protein VES42_23690 [Pilimelia sp.]|nr:hypothetical protein [Pilimelia sp.]
MKVAVFDIDGVVADVRHRLHHIARQPKDWAGFFAGAADDPPLAPGVTLARRYAADHRLVWLTGRPESLRRVTRDWLARHDLPTGRLLMRPSHDHRPARDYKADQLRRIAGWGAVATVVDDDPAVTARLLADGWPVRVADWVPYAESLRQAQEREGRT